MVNLLKDITPRNMQNFKWLNSTSFDNLADVGIRMKTPSNTDMFQDPAEQLNSDSSPFLYLDVTGDFVCTACVSHHFAYTFDAASILIRSDNRHWAKLCYEKTDFDTHAIVSVVTNEYSDDANCVNCHWEKIWLQVIRRGNLFIMNYSFNSEEWNKVRKFRLNLPSSLCVGMMSQCPLGDGSFMNYHFFSVE